MSIKPNLLLLCLLGAFLLSSCDKGEPTVINGVVTDRKTGAPVEGAVVAIALSTGPNNTTEDYLFSDAQGRFSAHYSPVYEKISILYVQSSGYKTLMAISGILEGQENSLDCRLLPIDASLNLKLANVSGIHDTAYVLIGVPSLVDEFPWFGTLKGSMAPEKFQVPPDSCRMVTYAIPSEEYVFIHWDTVYFKGFESTKRDSIHLIPGETIEVSILF